MVLGVQWLESLGPILWDFGCRSMAFVRNRHRVLWQAMTDGTVPPVLMVTEGDMMD
jgi:hypothetical protein